MPADHPRCVYKLQSCKIARCLQSSHSADTDIWVTWHVWHALEAVGVCTCWYVHLLVAALKLVVRTFCR